jgi:hypothetical protein
MSNCARSPDRRPGVFVFWRLIERIELSGAAATATPGPSRRHGLRNNARKLVPDCTRTLARGAVSIRAQSSRSRSGSTRIGFADALGNLDTRRAALHAAPPTLEHPRPEAKSGESNGIEPAEKALCKIEPGAAPLTATDAEAPQGSAPVFSRRPDVSSGECDRNL